ncbi:alpha/beta fold hydrolase [Phycicoccus sp. CSK15P-2]|uniref:alpha/beta hydrolase n=1 Tax=Phycicoccus sp. CSK15P-2 TaxID=2807627 RepID=UPI0019528679|nr:alpha/beta hydrolase [Phycicoccus sp. CSK15P-2]MBM6404481.1 alpha/beta fold hydrolase [Phycicoccus sp. CSK15P-2]
MRTQHTSRAPQPPRTRRLVASVAAATAPLLGLAACGASTGSGAVHTETRRAEAASRGGGSGEVTWGVCPEPAEGVTRDPRQTCGTLRVPLSYRDPHGPTLELAVSRLATAAPGTRRGVLLLNPGGPGLGGLDMPSTMATTLPTSVLERYDLVGFDPRGVEHSTPQSCGFENPGLADRFPYPAADGSIDDAVDLARADAQTCAEAVGADLRHFTTANTARDMDRIRQALGEERVSYWGQSYGTYLGAVYRAMFQERTDRMVLEGNVDPTTVWYDGMAATWGQGLADRFPDAAVVAAARSEELGLGESAAEVTRSYLSLADRLDREPAALPGTGERLDGALLRNVTYALLLHDDTLAPLTQFWAAASALADGTATEADAEVLDQLLTEAPLPPGIPADNQTTMFLALMCGDAAWPRDVAGYAERSAADRRAWPLSAGMPASIWACAFWSAPTEPPVAVGAEGARNVLILQNRRDNATPWEGALGLHRALGDRSALVGVDNGGHYVYGQGSACADDATVNFLTAGRLAHGEVYCTDVTRP